MTGKREQRKESDMLGARKDTRRWKWEKKLKKKSEREKNWGVNGYLVDKAL